MQFCCLTTSHVGSGPQTWSRHAAAGIHEKHVEQRALRDPDWGLLMQGTQQVCGRRSAETDNFQSVKSNTAPEPEPTILAVNEHHAAWIQVLLKILAYCDKVHYFP
ncbi:hypothetical protein AMECASPLE_037074 [Ameca splendens]|uniref:Uncharacterized protein n=1 Tax=Ameca splendens TaxID=208324 RepID=A0ABV0YJA6_9TELE